MSLASYVKKVRAEKQLSLKDVERAAANKITHGYINQIENGTVRSETVSVEKLKALAKGLGVPEDDVFRIARGRTLESDDRFEIYAERFDATDLDESEWRLLETHFRNQVEQYRETKKRLSPPAKKKS